MNTFMKILYTVILKLLELKWHENPDIIVTENIQEISGLDA